MSIMALVMLLVWLIVIGVIVWLIIYVANTMPLPHPFPTVIRVIAVVFGCLMIILLLLNFIGAVNIGTIPVN